MYTAVIQKVNFHATLIVNPPSNDNNREIDFWFHFFYTVNDSDAGTAKERERERMRVCVIFGLLVCVTGHRQNHYARLIRSPYSVFVSIFAHFEKLSSHFAHRKTI